MSEVLIVGAGPVGLTMAGELARHGIRCRIVDRLPVASGYCKAIGVTPRTLEVWENMGVAQPMIDAGLWLRGLRIIVNGHAHEAPMEFPELPYGNLGIPQYETERILTDHLGSFGVEVERACALTALQDEGARVGVTLEHGDGRRESVEFRYVVGCDGAHSAVRHALAIGFPGERFPMEFMLGDVAIDWDVPRGLGVFAIVPRENAAPDFLVVIPLPERNRYRISMMASDDVAEGGGIPEHGIAAERQGPSLEQLQNVTDRLLPGKPRLRDMRWSSLFGISMRLADRYRVGNCFIAGDAAHIHPPTGGQGMNTGIQDAYNLAWKMALVLRNQASERLLDSYEAERRPVGAEVVERTRQASLSFGRDRGPEDRLADTQIPVNYRGSASTVDEGRAAGAFPRAGDRAPDAQGLRRDQIGFPLRMFDLLKGAAHVVAIHLDAATAAARVSEIECLAQELRKRRGDGVRVVVVVAATGDPAPEMVGVAVVHDAEGNFAAAYAAQPGFNCIVRPDGYLAFAADALDCDRLRTVLDRTLA